MRATHDERTVPGLFPVSTYRLTLKPMGDGLGPAMPKRKDDLQVTRRNLLKGAAIAGAAAAAAPLPVAAQTPAGPARTTSPPEPDIEAYRVDGSPIVQTTSGSDYM